MLENIKNKLTRPTKAIGLSIHIQKDGSKEYSLCLLERKGTAINILAQEEGLKELSETKIPLDKSWPIALSLSGKGILTKKVKPPLSSPEEMLSKALPNADLDQFCLDYLAIEKEIIVTLARKDQINEQLKTLEAEGFQVLQCALGIATVNYLLPILPTSLGVVSFGNQRLQLASSQLQSIEAKSETDPTNLTINNNKITASVLPAFSVALGLLLNQNSSFYPSDFLEKSQENYKYQKLFQLSGWAMLLSLLCVLLLNFMAFSWLGEQNTKQTIVLSYHKTQLKQLASLREDLSEKQGFFQGNNILKNSKTSFYADDIGASLPEGIRLSRVEVFPIRVAKNSRQVKKSYEQELIRLTGESERSTVLNGWIKDLQVQDWVKQVRVLPYAEQTDGTGVFELELYIK